MATVKNTSITPDTWDGKYPLSDLPVNDTWNGSYGGASSCVGFAKMVLDATYGAGDAIGGSINFTSQDDIKSAFDNISVGDRVTFTNRNSQAYGTYHAIIVASKSSKGITAYDCNRVGTNKIGKTLLTWSYMENQYKNISGGYHHA